MIDPLKTLGIQRGKPFNPNSATNMILTSAVREAGAELEKRYDAGLPSFFSEKSRWTYPVPLDIPKAMAINFTDPNEYPIDSRGLVYSYAYVGIKHLGAGQFYSISIRDRTATRSTGLKPIGSMFHPTCRSSNTGL